MMILITKGKVKMDKKESKIHTTMDYSGIRSFCSNVMTKDETEKRLSKINGSIGNLKSSIDLNKKKVNEQFEEVNKLILSNENLASKCAEMTLKLSHRVDESQKMNDERLAELENITMKHMIIIFIIGAVTTMYVILSLMFAYQYHWKHPTDADISANIESTIQYEVEETQEVEAQS